MAYRNKNILAPMVRVGTLPMRLVSLDYGADLVYCEEIIDFKMLQSKRVENTLLGTIDYVMQDGTVTFRTCEQEKEKVVFQMGTADSKRAVQVAKMIEGDVAAVDINMGCPKEFSIKGGMGAALLSQPEKVKQILTALVEAVAIPITCKIRILNTFEETLSLVKLIESCGVAAIGIHGRLREERPRHPNHNDIIKRIAEAVTLPVIANGLSGQVKRYEDIEKYRLECGATSIMLARAAQWNPSIFRKEGMAPVHDVVTKCLKYAIRYDNAFHNTKYVVQQLLHKEMEEPRGQALKSSSNAREIYAIWDLLPFCDEMEQKQKDRTAKMFADLDASEFVKRRKLEDGSYITEMPLRYFRCDYYDDSTPKMILHNWAKNEGMTHPKYHTEVRESDRCFYAVLTFEGKKYASIHWDKSKKNAEQAAAVVCLRMLKMAEGRKETAGTGLVFDTNENQMSFSLNGGTSSTEQGHVKSNNSPESGNPAGENASELGKGKDAVTPEKLSCQNEVINDTNHDNTKHDNSLPKSHAEPS